MMIKSKSGRWRKSIEVPVEVVGTIWVDACIADEIDELNNKHGIKTIFSCCGHGRKDSQGRKSYGYVHVVRTQRNLRMMKELGYVRKDGPHYKPKTECSGKCGAVP